MIDSPFIDYVRDGKKAMVGLMAPSSLCSCFDGVFIMICIRSIEQVAQ